jgi:flagellar hook-associated protein 3 FlgL
MSSIMTEARGLVVQAVSTNTDTSYMALSGKLDELINQLVSEANTQIGDRYVFAGQSDKTQPVKRDGDVFTYLGDDSKISMVVKPGPVDPQQDSVNVTGTEIFGQSMDLLNHLTEIKNQLKTGHPDLDFLSNTGLKWVSDDHDRLLQMETEVGSRMSMYEMAGNMLEDDSVIITTDLANNEDLDLSKAAIDYKSADTAYQSALAIGARIMPTSLLDFLK